MVVWGPSVVVWKHAVSNPEPYFQTSLDEPRLRMAENCSRMSMSGIFIAGLSKGPKAIVTWVLY